ncbi:hypothetical protein B0H34DRAFT_799544 [Crassisporium funariophilum]|nr:hypothetical protein B0H34DRAFT_799544 [Crassisporium funariophilum]
MSKPDSQPLSAKDLLYILNHVFLPPKLPQEDDNDADHDIILCQAVCDASANFVPYLPECQQGQWSAVTRMVNNLLKITQVREKKILVANILELKVGDALTFHVRAQNAAIILRRIRDCIVFEAFEVTPSPQAFMKIKGKLICSYPGPAVELPISIAQDRSFVEQLVSFLLQMDVDRLGAEATTTKAGSKVLETRDTTHPRYITQLLVMILLGMGKEAEVDRISKRITDEVCWLDANNPWRRSSLWLVLRVAIQTTASSRDIYKAFMIFFQNQLLQLFLEYKLSSELLYTTRVKTSRRVYKLGSSASPLLMRVVEKTGQAIQQCLEARWTEEQRRQAFFPSYTPDRSAFKDDTTISLLKSRSYLTKVRRPDPYNDTVSTFHPSHRPRLRDVDDFQNLYPDGLTEYVKADTDVALADFETLVQEQLTGWVKKHRNDVSACQTLGSCLQQYISTTKTHYSSRPEDQSLMLLTIMELWVALDIITIAQCPLLSSYSPEIPASVLDPLLLRRTNLIDRAATIEHYLRRRHSDATMPTSIYSNQMDQTTFAVRYFRQSSSLCEMKASIERDAAYKRDCKRAELQQQNLKHIQLTREIAGCTCKYIEVYSRRWSDYRTVHAHGCHKCKLVGEADNMSITVHEWPLADDPLKAEAIVFELNCPPAFSIWRTRTYQILRDVFMAHVAVASVHDTYALENYEGLTSWSKEGTSGRIVFASATKSFLKSHYRGVRIPSKEDSVCLNSGLDYKLYDSVRWEWVVPSFDTRLETYCTLRLPKEGEKLYQHLQDAVALTTHTHNETIVNQGDCPINLSMHEQLAFSNLRCGSLLQWMNIARELRTNVLTFSREEVHTLVTQAAWQLGPLSSDGSIREWHCELAVPTFAFVLIQECNDLLSRVRGNWMEGTTVKSIIYLASRLLASFIDGHQEGYALLREARDVTHKWMHQIAHKLQSAVDDDDASDLQRRACEMAAICRATYDVDAGTHLNALLCSSKDVAILVECSITVYDNTPCDLGDSFPDLQRLLHRDRRLFHSLESRLSECIHSDKCGLDIAISSVWSGYRKGDGGWQRLDKHNSRWLTSFTAPSNDQQAQQVHYNMLNGNLLIGGKTLGRLPRDIVHHPAYKRIFSQKVFDVVPADMPGMDYATRTSVCDYQLFFALRGSSNDNLIIRARTSGQSAQVFELIPHNVLLADFPTFLATDNAHWMDVETGEVEFRPLDQLWVKSPQNWHLLFSPDGPSEMVQGTPRTRHLVDIRSRTFQGIAARICPLEYPEYLIVTHDVQSQIVLTELPRFRLSFFLNNADKLESKNMQGMIIDDNQCTGTMIGLSSQLVLCHGDPVFASLPRSRFVLVPHGTVQFSLPPDQDHVRVYIDTRTKSMRKVVWYKYEIDSDLGLLVGNVNYTSRLFRIYLHALCSHPLPDPLTTQTGTDHALQELVAAGCFSFQRLTEADVELLRLIGSITPSQHYYPKHLRVMQTTEWSPRLPALSQHGMFDTAVHSILQYAQSLTVFPDLKDGRVQLDYECSGDSFLTARTTRRRAVYHEGGANVKTNFDEKHCSRDSPHIADYDSAGIQAYKTSELVYSWPVGLTRHLGNDEILEGFKEWGHMSGPTPNASLNYTQEWLRLDLPAKWISIYDSCRKIERPLSEKFQLIFSFASVVYQLPNLQKWIPILLAFATMRKSSLILPPQHLSYHLEAGFEPVRELVRELIVAGIYDLDESPAGELGRESNESTHAFNQRRSNHYKNISQPRINNAVDNLMGQWPCSTPLSPFHKDDDSRWFKTSKIMRDVEEYFTKCYHNTDLRSFTSHITRIVQENYTAPPSSSAKIPRFRFVPTFLINRGQLDSPFTLEALLSSRANFSLPCSIHDPGTTTTMRTTPKPGQLLDTSVLEKLISQFKRNHHSALHRRYSDRLERSKGELDGQRTSILPETFQPPENATCVAYRDQCLSRLCHVLSSIRSVLTPLRTTEKILANACLWPRIHPRIILQPLASRSDMNLSLEWIECFTTFAEVFIEYQHSQRLLAYALRSEGSEFLKELNKFSMNQSDARGNRDWLLIQIQGNFSTRAIQSEVAREMITPSSVHNTVLQLNMGEGKSHVIVPLVAVALADSQKLVRIVVLKPLANQMFQLLVERISGLPNRRIFYLPFSRDVKMGLQQAQQIRWLFEECARVQGVLVAQPEHILSFRLMVIDRMLSSESHLDQVAQELQATQAWLTSTSRDILDESDELLHVRYQLIYTMDQQQTLDHSPDRWITTQKMFDLVGRHMGQLHEKYPEEVELFDHRAQTCAQGGYSYSRLLGMSASRALVDEIAEDVLDGRLDNLTFVGLNALPSLRAAVLNFMKDRCVNAEDNHAVETNYKDTDLWNGLLLLRGLLAHGILVYVLGERRWRVDYGLDTKRSMLSVPYRAKDVPSLRSEFGHPDITVCLTCLSYYYGGLTLSQVRDSFVLLLKLDNPSLEYEKWVRRGGEGIPELLRHLMGVNMKDVKAFTKVVIPIFQYNKAVIDFFLSRVVFPKEAKEFPSKLGTSGWDLAEKKPKDNFTTGFSGTNDHSDLLPISITQSDPVNQLRTNAQVLDYLLRPENDKYICAQGGNGQPCTVKEILELLVQGPKEIRVLLDVGAQMLELTNQELVKQWLLLTREDVKAGVFFDDSDDLVVLSRDGSVERLYLSPFFKMLHQCIIYLDDAHTRGTDLKLPVDFQAMVTLGPKVTKDKLVQGCMRMRKLGHGQTVVFCAPPEVDRLIRRSENIENCPVKVIDVLSWVMYNTCTDIEHYIPHWVQQGVYHHKRRIGDDAFSSHQGSLKLFKDAWLQPAARTLDEMYSRTTESSSTFDEIMPAMRERLLELGVTEMDAEPMAEEQEREVSHEVEQELQLERPPKAPPAVHHLDSDVRLFVRSGVISPNFLPLMTPLGRSETHMPSLRNPWSRQLLATRDFMSTTKLGKEESILTDYLRPVNWIVSLLDVKRNMVLVVMSPFEVNHLLPEIRESHAVRLHMYAPRTIRSMKSFEDLTFYCIPPLSPGKAALASPPVDMRVQLNIWAGQLYLDEYETYLRLCMLLGISPTESAQYHSVERDRFVPSRGRNEEMASVCLFNKSPVPLLKSLFGLRRKGLSYDGTHMGQILHARILTPEDFDELIGAVERDGIEMLV